MVPPDSYRVSRAPHYSGYHYDLLSLLIPGYHRLWLLFPKYSNSSHSNIVVLQPQYCRNNTGLGYSDFARRYYRNHFCFLFLRVLRCFSSPGLPPCGYYIFNIVGCPIRISSDQRVCAPPRSFSQLITSFIASESLGIPHTPLFSLLHFYSDLQLQDLLGAPRLAIHRDKIIN